MAGEQTSKQAYEELYEASGYVNHLSLDESILDQPQLFGHCSAWCGYWGSKRDRLKRDADVTDARVYLRIRTEMSGDKKPTEALLAALVMVDQESLDAHNRYFKAQEQAKLWDGLLEAFKQRSYSLSQYVNWRSGDYVHERVTREDHRSGNRRLRQ